MSEPVALRQKQVELLEQLSRGEQSVSEIAVAWHRRPGPVSTSLATLQRHGLAELSRTSAHSAPGQPLGRWSLTEHGQAVCESLEPTEEQSALDRPATDRSE